ncbi:MAG: lipid kinase [Rhodospirillales bacterium 20-60-12]|nr:MAG: lipid kinase [Rhodospirillales bacterium 20-60-12]HQT67814.1 ABC transporter permease subunit [Acetobacteraceae bacterium]
MRLINRHPNPRLARVLTASPFVAVAVVYVIASTIRHAANPDDKLLPTIAQMGAAMWRMAAQQDMESGDYLMLNDTIVSLQRLLLGLGISLAVSFAIGVSVGMIPYLKRLFVPFINAFSMVPPLAILPILFIVAGIGETAKVSLIVLGTAPYMIRDLILRVEELPRPQIIKAQTLGAGDWQIALRVVVPQMLPRLIDSLRLSLGPAWLYLISAEAIAAENGLGYRIFLVRRYFAMDIILPYVAWITLLAFFADLGLRWLQHAAFPWFAGARAQ